MMHIKSRIMPVFLIVILLYNSFSAGHAYAMYRMNKTASDFSFTLINDKEVSLSEYDNDITVLLFGDVINCYYTQMTINQIPELNKVFKKNKVKFIVLDINNNSKEEIIKYKKDNNYKNIEFSVGEENESVMWDYIRLCNVFPNSIIMPAIFILDENKQIIYHDTGPILASDLMEHIVYITGESILSSNVTDYRTYEYKNNIQMYKSARTDSAALKYYTQASSDVKSDSKKLIDLSNRVTASITSDYEKLKAIHDWVCDNIYYDFDYYYHRKGETSNGALDTYENKYSVCQGYAELTAALIRAAGIPCKIVDGYAIGGGSHTWNEAYIDNRWVILDTTWDSNNSYENNIFTHRKNTREYFDVGLEYLSMSHKIDISGEDYSIIPNKITGVSINRNTATSVTVKWNKMDEVAGYEIKYSINKRSGYISAGFVKSSMIKLDELEKGNTYYFKIRGYITFDGKKYYGPYSSIKNVKL